ncbi:MAG: S1C family serine protease [Prevotella sp.]|nr:S1C family serine protease [Prevotella sp.]
MRLQIFIKSCSLLLCLLCISSCRKASTSRTRHEQQTEYAQPKEEAETVRPSSKNGIINKRSSKKLDGREVFDKYSTSVFMVFTSDGTNGYQGSGFFIDNEGLAVSNYHVFKGTGIGMEKIKLLGSDVVHNVIEIIAKDEEEDYILFRVDCDKTNYLPLASSKPQIGEKVFAIGSPRGLENTFSSGEVSQWRSKNLMQINALIDHGSSGGALINEYGEVVGITSGSFYDGSQANLNYAWSIDVIKPYLK